MRFTLAGWASASAVATSPPREWPMTVKCSMPSLSSTPAPIFTDVVSGRPAEDARSLSCGLVARTSLRHRRFDLLLHRLKVERRAFLHRRKLDGSLRKLADLLLDVDEPPEFAGVEVVEEGRRTFEHIGDRKPLEWILLDVLKDRHVDRNLRSWPAFGLVDEAIFEFIEAKAAKVGFGKIPNLMASRWSLAGDKVGLIVTVEMHFEGLIADLLPGLQFIDDVRIARRRHEGREPVEPGDYTILNLARRHLARPANDRRHAEAALIHGALCGAERSHAAVRPSEHLRTVISGEHDDGVVGYA